MHVPLVMTVIGKDRPGLVESVARLVADHGGNWLESRMCRLGGEFAGILRVRVPGAQEAALGQALQGLQAQGLRVVVQPDLEPSTPPPGRQALLEVVGQDRPGIVRQITTALARQQVNVEEFTSECSSAPMSGETLFTARAHLRIPESCNAGGLRQELERIAADLLIDITFEEIA
jgi:glycine cleavage system regulatory protein